MEQESSVIQWLSREPTPFWHGDDEDSLSSPCHNGVEDEDREFGNDAQEEVSLLYIQVTWIIVIIFFTRHTAIVSNS